MNFRYYAALALILCSTGILSANAEDRPPMALERAEGEDLSVAMGHYARARSLILAALGEFDQGYKLADPKVILDAKHWRNSLIDRAQELERLLDPQPRVSRRGMKYKADTRLLNEAKK
ncbi:MAG: hypothetical protein K1X79_09500 [Oligoflexia bacterium]|nr:hypothetical protein [Oligoflexia bacterium]